MKKLLSVLLAVAMVATMVVGCGSDKSSKSDKKESSDFKAGFVLVGDENEGYTYSHIEGAKEAMDELGLTDDNAVWKYSIGEDEACYDAIADCVDQGCSVVFTNSYGHQSFAKQAAEEFTDVQIVALTGDTAATAGLDNFSNAFTKIFEARYVGGVVAGMKIKELDEKGEIPATGKDGDKVKVGYVGAYPYAEVVSGYTAFFLGIQSVYPNVVMDVQYTNSWFDITGEKEAANALIDKGCVIIGQHADSTGAPSACEDALKAGKVVYSVGYNVDMLSTAPTAALTSPTNKWYVYYKYALEAAMNGEKIDNQWAQGYEEDAVAITELGKSCAEGTQEAVDKAIEDIKSGSLHVFDITKFTVGGKAIDDTFEANVEPDDNYAPDTKVVHDGFFDESNPEFRAAPYFECRIDGITELN